MNRAATIHCLHAWGTLYELLRTGVVPSIRIGTCRRVAALDLADLVDKLRLADDAQLRTAATAERAALLAALEL